MLLKVVDEIEKVHPREAASGHGALAEQDDNTLVAAAQSVESSEAFNILVRRHRAKMLRAALRFTRNEADAEDIVQQSFEKAFLHLQQFAGHSSFSTWLTRIAINEALMWMRKRRTSQEILIDQSRSEGEGAVALDVADTDPSPEDTCLERERKQILAAALKELRPGLRRAIELRELAELSTEDAARVMGLSVGAVKARVFHGRRRLRQLLERHMLRRQSFRVRCTQFISNNRIPSACS
jgi:RNA polymerase sigma-70 factor, ECF subfamily